MAAAPGPADPAKRADPVHPAYPAHPGYPAHPVVVDVRGLAGAEPGAPPEAALAAVAALARLRLAARRSGHAVRLRGAAAGLRELLELVGLAGEFEWEAEEREDLRGVEE